MTIDATVPEPAQGAAEKPFRSAALADVGIAVALWVPGCLIFFRSAFRSGFDKINGDSGDARFLVYVHEHWVQVLRGEVSWTSPQYFFPTKGALGYSDTCVLNQIFYLPLRAVGLDQFLAFQWTLILMSLAAFVAVFVLVRSVFSVGIAVAAASSTAFVFANNLSVVSGHAQLYSIYWIPVILLTIALSLRATSRRTRLAWAFAAGALLGLLFYSTYYIPWFATLGGLIFGVIFGALRVVSVGRLAVWKFVRAHLSAAGAFLVAFGLAMIPFVITYVPALRTSGGRSYADAMFYAASPRDTFNVSNTNYVWGSVVRSLLPAQRLRNVEVSLAMTPILVAAAVTGAIIVWRISRAVPREAWLRDVGAACAITLVALILLPVKFSLGSLWRIPWTLVPGAVGIRAIDRLALIGGVFAVGAIACAARVLALRRVAHVRQHWITAGTAVVLALMVAEQLNTAESSFVDRSDELKALAVAPAPPAECASFYVTDSAPGSVSGYASNIDAMLISQHLHIPTVNGYAGQFPKGFVQTIPGVAGYDEQIRAWAASNGVETGLCSYDRTTHRWAATTRTGS